MAKVSKRVEVIKAKFAGQKYELVGEKLGDFTLFYGGKAKHGVEIKNVATGEKLVVGKGVLKYAGITLPRKARTPKAKK